MKYIEVVKAVREEKMKKEASVKKLAGLLKKAGELAGEQLTQAVPRKRPGQSSNVYRNRLQAISNRVKGNTGSWATNAGKREYLDYLKSPQNWKDAAESGGSVLSRGAVDIPAQAARTIGSAILPISPAISAAMHLGAEGYTSGVTNKLLPKTDSRQLLEKRSPALRHVNNFLQDLTGTAILGNALAKNLGMSPNYRGGAIDSYSPNAWSNFRQLPVQSGLAVMQRLPHYMIGNKPAFSEEQGFKK